MGIQINSRYLLKVSALAIVLVSPDTELNAQTWKPDPSNSNWFSVNNWTPNTVPNLASAEARFGASSLLTPNIGSGYITVGSVQFLAGAPGYTIQIANTPISSSLTIGTGGIVNDSNAIQTLSTSRTSTLNFNNSQQTANKIIINNYGQVNFNGTTTAGSIIINTGRPSDGFGNISSVYFRDNASAGNSIINVSNYNGMVQFSENTTAADSTINVTNGFAYFYGSSSAASANINLLADEALVTFSDTTSAGSADFDVRNGNLVFQHSSTASDAVINANGARAGITFMGQSTAGSATLNMANGYLYFDYGGSAGNAIINAISSNAKIFIYESATAENATINLNSGNLTFDYNGSAGSAYIDNLGGTVTFNRNSSADGATIANGTKGIIVVDANTPLSIGSLSGGGEVELVSELRIGGLNRDDALSATISGSGSLSKIGSGTLTLSGENEYEGGTTLNAGVISIGSDKSLGDGSGSLQFSGGRLLTTQSFSSGRSFVFNTSGTIETTDGTTLTHTGALSGASGLNKEGFGTLILAGDNSYLGPTSVKAGMLKINSAITSDTAVESAATLAGFGTIIGDVTNSGTIFPGGGNVSIGNFGTMTVEGNYTGAGLVVLNTMLDDENSPTDALHVTGDTSGASTLKVNNIGGDGGLTVANGIRLIEVDGASDGVFTLLGDYRNDGEVAIVAGAYAYKLYQNGVTDPADGNWYLRSQLKKKPVDPIDPTKPVDPIDPTKPVNPVDPTKPVDPNMPVDPVNPRNPPLYQAGVPVYEAYPQLLLGLNGLPSLQQRIGNRYWNNAGNKIVAEGSDAIGTAYATPAETRNYIDSNGVWGRIEGSHNRVEPNYATAAVGYDYNAYRLQAGLDGMLWEHEAGRLIGGITVQYARGTANSWSVYDADNGGGKIQTDGYGVGGTLTWYGENGVYFDTQAQAIWFESDLSFDGGSLGLIDSNRGLGYAVSLEGGKRIALDQAWSLTPQAQLIWSVVDFDSFDDAYGASVTIDHGRSLQGRIGMALDHQTSWYNGKGMVDRTQVYGLVNLYYEFLEGSKISVSETALSNRNQRLWGGIGIGGSYNWDNDKYAIYGEGSFNTSLTQFSDSYTYKGTIGFRAKW